MLRCPRYRFERSEVDFEIFRSSNFPSKDHNSLCKWRYVSFLQEKGLSRSSLLIPRFDKSSLPLPFSNLLDSTHLPKNLQTFYPPNVTTSSSSESRTRLTTLTRPVERMKLESKLEKIPTMKFFQSSRKETINLHEFFPYSVSLVYIMSQDIMFPNLTRFNHSLGSPSPAFEHFSSTLFFLFLCFVVFLQFDPLSFLHKCRTLIAPFISASVQSHTLCSDTLSTTGLCLIRLTSEKVRRVILN